MIASDIVQNIENRIIKGELSPGARMPSTRTLSSDLGVAPGTVARAYRQLTERGLLTATTGRGTFVANTQDQSKIWPDRFARTDDTLPEFSRAALTNRWLFESRANDGIQLMGGYGDVNKPLGQGLLARIKDHGGPLDPRFHELQPADGAMQPRTSIARCLGRMMLRDIEPGQIVLANGAHTLLDMTLRALTRPGDAILVEHPAYYGALDLFDAHRLKVIPISRTEVGLDLSALEIVARTHDPKFFYFSGSPSTPCGHMLNTDDQMRLLSIHRRLRLPIIEDSSLWPFSFDDQRFAPLFSLDRDDLVIHICSFSKWFFPSLRFAVAIGTSREFTRLRQINRGITRISSAFPQFAVGEYLESPAFASDMTASVKVYESARDAFCTSLERHVPTKIKLRRPEAGFSVWLDIPQRLSSSQLYGQCTRLGVYPLLGKVFSLEDKPISGVRLAYGQNSETSLVEGARRFGKAIETLLKSNEVAASNALP